MTSSTDFFFPHIKTLVNTAYKLLETGNILYYKYIVI